MADYPTTGESPWGEKLRLYIAGLVEPLQAQIEELSAAIEPVRTSVESLAGDVESLSNTVSPIPGQVSTLGLTVEGLAASIPEVPADLSSRLLPTDGSQDMLLKRDTGSGKIAVWQAPEPLSKYRGAWGPDEEVYFDDFGDNTIAPFGNYQPLVAVPALNIESMATNGGTSKPAYATVLRIASSNSTNGQRCGSTLTLNTLPSLAGKTLTRVKLWAATGGTMSNRTAEILEGEILRDSPGFSPAWAERTIVLSSGGASALNLQLRNTGSTAGTAYLYVAGVRVYGTSAPYLRGDVVDYLGSFYRSEVSNNSATPGTAGSQWTLIVV